MRWSIIRLIWVRELRDQLRDRRTMFMIVVLPVLLYPVLGIGVVRFALAYFQKPTTVGVSAPEEILDPRGRDSHFELPPLFVRDNDTLRFLASYCDKVEEDGLQIEPLSSAPPSSDNLTPETIDRTPLDTGKVALLLVVPSDFRDRVRQGKQPRVLLLTRAEDARSPLVAAHVRAVLLRWQDGINRSRLQEKGLPAEFLEPFQIDDPVRDRSETKGAAEGIMGMLVRIFPFLLVMWSLTGALYPAVDLCAGEKERGTMETLLISPASREEIVYGKFLTIWVFSGVTALLNLASIGLTTFSLSSQLPVLQPAALLWCVLLVLPLSAFFSALCLALGAYARSSKEGQYYLMPLFLVTMPLIFLTLAPGVELNPLFSLVPVTGVALLLQKLMTAPTLDKVPWVYFVPVLAPTVLYGWLALRWAVLQFHREEVLFREAERLDVRLWLRRLFREKEPLPSVGQAMFCFGLIASLGSLSLVFDPPPAPLLHTAINLVAFVSTPALLMALLLTSRPAVALQIRWPPPRSVLTALLLAVMLAVPLLEVTSFLLQREPNLEQMLSDNDPLAKALLGHNQPWWQDLLVLAVLAAVCKEIAFRGFILSGLRRRFKPWTAILLSSFLFALAHLNVFLFLPSFCLGVILGLLATRSGSIVPGLVCHVVFNALLLVLVWTGDWTAWVPLMVRWGFALVCAGGAILYLLVSGFRLWVYGPTVHDDVLLRS